MRRPLLKRWLPFFMSASTSSGVSLARCAFDIAAADA